MMERFDRLEIDEKLAPATKKADGEQIRNAKFFYDKARQCENSGDWECALRNYSKSVAQNINFIESWEGQILILIELGEYEEAITWSDKALEMFPANPVFFATKALAYYRNALPSEAVAFSDNAISKKNITANVWLVRAEIMVKKRYAIVESCIEKALAISGDDRGQILLRAGMMLNKNKKYIYASELLSEAVILLPKSPMVWFELGKAQFKSGSPFATQSFERSLSLKEDWLEAIKWLKKCKYGWIVRVLNRKLC